MNTTTDPKTETIADAFDRLMRENAEQAAEIARLKNFVESVEFTLDFCLSVRGSDGVWSKVRQELNELNALEAGR